MSIINPLLAIGDKFTVNESQQTGRISDSFGSGGQGQVFKALLADGSVKAVKVYHPYYLTDNPWLKKKIPALVDKGAPGERFLWPEGTVRFKTKTKLFGYIMPVKSSNYLDAVSFLQKPVSYRTMLRACTQISKSFDQLHSRGLCYRDINYNNVCIDPNTGDSLVIDNDNVDFDSDDCEISIGFPSFIAPEVLNGTGRPSSDSDRYALAILYYYLFFRSHPLDGKSVLQYDIWGADDQNKHYKSAVYHFHPTDKSNEATQMNSDDVEGHAGHNAIYYRQIFPNDFLAHFDKTFVQGLDQKHMRTIESVWRTAFDNLGHQILYCSNPNCADPQTGPRENFYRGEFVHHCYQCKSEIALPPRMRVMPDNKIFVLSHNIELRSRHIGPKKSVENQDVVVSNIEVHPERGVWGLKNGSTKNWKMQFEKEGDLIAVEPGRRISLNRPKIVVDFGNGRRGTIRCGRPANSETPIGNTE